MSMIKTNWLILLMGWNLIAIIDNVAIILCRIRQPWRYV